MSKTESDKDKLPWFYRLILRLPKIEVHSDLQGVYWAIVIPAFLIFEFFLSLFLLTNLSFPINLVTASVIPITVFVVFVKVQLERFMDWWNSTFRSEPMRWDVQKATEEYILLLKKQGLGKRNLSVPTEEKDRKED